ncbi:MAG: hypothetical protein EP330_20235 [Deltaproteobacteria bacterium]|nr:MAG: hypothetical protein EP330_20235 [Deltaproteobacteria bacterium]
MWIVIATALAAPGLSEVEGWHDTTLVFSGTEMMSYLPRGIQVEDASDYEQETWQVKCISPSRAPMRCWDLAAEGSHQAEARVPLGTLDEYKAWSSKHPVTPAKSEAAMGGKSIAFHVAMKGEEPETFPGKASLSLGYDGSGTYHVEVARGGQTWKWTDVTKLSGGGAYNRGLNLAPYWRADGRYVAIVEADPGGFHMRGPIPASVEVRHANAALVTLMAHESLSESATDTVSWRLADDLDLHFQRVEPAKKARTDTVVYYAKGFEHEAREITEVIPGGGGTEPLSWASQADLVVAIGSSAER